MRCLRALCLCVVSFLPLVTFSQTSLQTSQEKRVWRVAKPSEKFVPGQLLVRFRDEGPSDKNAVSRAHPIANARTVRKFRSVPGLELIQLPTGTKVREALRLYRNNRTVKYAEPNYIFRGHADPDDPLFPQQWALRNTAAVIQGKASADVQADEAWTLATGSNSVIVAVIDSGVDYTHPDLAANIYRNDIECNNNGVDDDTDGYVDNCYGINTEAKSGDPMDEYGHGTHVAGIIGAAGNNGIGITGLNWNVKILPCRFMNALGWGTTEAAIACLNYIRELKLKGVNIVASNNSWGGQEYSQALHDAIEAQQDANILFVASSGNEFSNNDQVFTYPAGYDLPGIVSVAASTSYDEFAFFSNLGRWTVHLAAPGQDVLSTVPGGYLFASGTSMAAPYVTATAALLAAKDPSRDWKTIKNLLLTGADPLPAFDGTITGARLNAYGALSCVGKSVQKRLRPLGAIASGAKGSPLLIEMLNVNCGSPSAPMFAEVSSGEQVSLLDDGQAPDQVAGDGIFSGSWTPAEQGSYSLTLPNGEIVPLQVLSEYVASRVIPEYREITGTSLDLKDDGIAKIASPFVIPFGRGTFNELWVSANGTVSFTHGFSDFMNFVLPIGKYTDPGHDRSITTIVAPLWDDWVPVQGSEHNVFWEVAGQAPNRELVIEWRNVFAFECPEARTDPARFQVVFREDSPRFRVEIADATTDCWFNSGGRSATVGVQVAPQVGVTAYAGGRINDTLVDDSAFEFQPSDEPRPENPVPAITKLVPNFLPAGQVSQWITVVGTNFVVGSEVKGQTWGSLPTRYVSSTELQFLADQTLSYNPVEFVIVENPSPGGGTSNLMKFGIGIEPIYLESITPEKAPAGSPALTIRLRGKNFTNALDVHFGQEPFLPFRVISDTEIHLDVPARLLTTPGTALVAVYRQGPGLSNLLPFTIVQASAQQPFNFNDPRDNSPGQHKTPRFNRFLGWNYAKSAGEAYTAFFSRPPIDHSVSSTVQSSMTGGLGLTLRPELPAGYLPTGVATADFNRDGNSDWVVSNGGESTLTLYLGRGDGTSAVPITLKLRGVSPVWIATADLNQDGDADIVIAEIDSSTVGVLLGRGNGTFAREELYPAPGAPTFLVTGDFNADGNLDVAAGMASSIAAGAVAMFPGNGDGRLRPPVTTPSQNWNGGSYVNWMTVADFNRDGLVDLGLLEWGDYYANGIWTYINTGDGHFKRTQQVTLTDFGWNVVQFSVEATDINRDGCVDLAVAELYSGIKFLRNKCDGSFAEETGEAFGTGENTWAIVARDIDSDGDVDIVGSPFDLQMPGYGQSSGALLSVLKGNGTLQLQRARVYRGGRSAYALATADLNKDGTLDVITPNQDSDSVSIYINDGLGGFGTPEGRYIGYYAPDSDQSGYSNAPLTMPMFIDATGDGIKDLVVIGATRSGADAIVAIQTSDGTFTDVAHSRVPGGLGRVIWDITIGDFRGTGLEDIVYVGRDSNYQDYYAYLRNNGDGTFTGSSFKYTNFGSALVDKGDFDRDGKLDFVVAGYGNTGSQLTIFRGVGSGTFAPQAPIIIPEAYPSTPPTPISLNVADFNGDGKFDVLVLLSMNSSVPDRANPALLFTGKGDGTFSTAREVLHNPNSFVVGDVNDDSLPDVIELLDGASSQYAELAWKGLRVNLCQPDGSFTLGPQTPISGGPINAGPLTNYPPARKLFPISLADYDGDGNKDFALFQFEPGWNQNGSNRSLVRFLKGRGDGTFEVQDRIFNLGTLGFPSSAVDLDGDGDLEFVELDSLTSSFHVLQTSSTPELQLKLLANPLLGNRGALRVSLLSDSSTSRQIQLAANNPAVQLPSVVTIAPGTRSIDVLFDVSGSLEPGANFQITGSYGSLQASVYGSRALNSSVGPRIYNDWPASDGVFPGESTIPMLAGATSEGGYEGTLKFRCVGLPASATCHLDRDEIVLAKGLLGEPIHLSIDTSPSTPMGQYTIQLIASDPTGWEQTLEYGLGVGDFSIRSLTSEIKIYAGQSYSGMSAQIDTTNGYDTASINVNCENLPVTCSFTGVGAGVPFGVGFNPASIPAGHHTLTLSAGNSFVTRSVHVPVRMLDVLTSFNPETLNLKLQETATVEVKFDAPYGFDQTLEVVCSASQGVTCKLDTNTVIFDSGEPTSRTIPMTIQAVKIPGTSAIVASDSSQNKPAHVWGLAIIAIGFAFGGTRSKRIKIRGASLILSAAMLMVACGGGGSGGGTNPPPPPQPPPPSSGTATVMIQIKSDSLWYKQTTMKVVVSR